MTVFPDSLAFSFLLCSLHSFLAHLPLKLGLPLICSSTSLCIYYSFFSPTSSVFVLRYTQHRETSRHCCKCTAISTLCLVCFSLSFLAGKEYQLESKKRLYRLISNFTLILRWSPGLSAANPHHIRIPVYLSKYTYVFCI